MTASTAIASVFRCSASLGLIAIDEATGRRRVIVNRSVMSGCFSVGASLLSTDRIAVQGAQSERHPPRRNIRSRSRGRGGLIKARSWPGRGARPADAACA
jgi:hypothetical protein